MSGRTVAAALDRILSASAIPRSITVDHGTEFTSRALEDWAYRRGVALDFIHPGKPVQNAHIESFNGRLRDECLNMHQFVSLEDAAEDRGLAPRLRSAAAPQRVRAADTERACHPQSAERGLPPTARFYGRWSVS